MKLLRAIPSRWFRLTFGAFLICLALQSGERPVNDGYAAFIVAEGLVDDGNWIYYPGYSPGYSVVGPDGQAYSKFGLGMSLLLAPVVWCADILSLGVEDPVHSQVMQTLVLRVPLAFTGALAFVFLFFWAHREMGLERKKSIWLSAAAIFCTPAWVYFRVFYAEGLLTCACVGAVVFALMGRKRDSSPLFFWAGVMASIGLLAKPTGILLFPLVVFLGYSRAENIRRQGLRLLWAAAGAAPGVMLALAYNWVRTGSVLGSTYTEGIDRFGFSTPLDEGLYGLLLSPGKGLLFYSPLALLGALGWLRRWRTPSALGVMAFSGIIVLISARWWAWHGGECWGPRLIVPVLPLLVVGVVHLIQVNERLKWLVMAFVVWGLGVSILGTTIHWQAHYERVPYTSWAEAMAESSPDDSVDALGQHNLEEVHGIWENSGIPAHHWLLSDVLSGKETSPPWEFVESDASPYGLNFWMFWPDGNTSGISFLLVFLFFSGGLVLLRESLREFGAEK